MNNEIIRNSDFDFDLKIEDKKGVISFLKDFIKYLKIFGRYSKYPRQDLITKMKDVKQHIEWDKDIAKIFGETLKIVKGITNTSDKIYQQYNNTCDNSYSFFQIGQLSSNIEENISENIVDLNQYYMQFNCKVRTIVCGSYHTLMLLNNGDVYSWGNGAFGRLGLGTKDNRKYPTKIETVSNVKYITSGFAYSGCISDQLYMWGASENGRLGIGEEIDGEEIVGQDILIPTPVQCTNIQFEKVVCGSTHTCAISTQKELYTWGNWKYCGKYITDQCDLFSPVKIDSLSHLLFESISIGPGGYHTMALTTSGELYTWGHNRVGQLGRGIDININQENMYSYISRIPEKVNTVNNIIGVSAGWGHSAILTSDGKVMLCGRNTCSQLGIDISECSVNSRGHPYISNFTEVDLPFRSKFVLCGGEHTIVVNNQEIYAWGDNAYNQLGNINEDGILTPQKILDVDGNTCKISVGMNCSFILWK
jgi:alpha-tubulin suppressor-like RCC1 family protein